MNGNACVSKFKFVNTTPIIESSCVCSTNLSIAGAPWFDAFFRCEVCIRPRWFAHCNWAFENPCDSPCHYSRLYIRRSYRRQLRSVLCKLLGFCKKKEIGLNNYYQIMINNRFLRERSMTSNPKMEYQIFLCIFQKNSAMATLGLKEMAKFLWKGREKGLPCWLSHFSFANSQQGRPFSLPSQRNFPISFKPKVAIA